MFPNVVYKIASKNNWSKFIYSGLDECMGFDADLKDGFIHCSTHEQLYPTFIKKYNLSEKYKFMLIAVDLDKVDDVRWTIAKNSNIYPHLYSPLKLSKNILWTYKLENYQFDADGL